MTTRAKGRRAKSAAAGADGAKAARVIRKYPNRRLYDTVESRYVTLADIRRLVVDRVDFVVLDRKSQRDITPARRAGSSGWLGRGRMPL